MGSTDRTWDKNISTPVLLSYRRGIDTVDTNQHDQSRQKDSEKKPKCPTRSFSLCSLLPSRKRTGKWEANTTYQQRLNHKENISQREIERFEQDFVFPSRELDSKTSKTTRNSESEKQTNILFHSSSLTSFTTETDSGAFSRLSSPDGESEYSDFSDSSLSLDNPTLQLCGAYSAQNKKPGNRKPANLINKQYSTKSAHSRSDCPSIVTVNGVCYQCA